jgi:hypothetical protein
MPKIKILIKIRFILRPAVAKKAICKSKKNLKEGKAV